jgi:hypothetical protein
MGSTVSTGRRILVLGAAALAAATLATAAQAGLAAKVGPADRRAIGALLTAFVRDAVARGNPLAAYGLATPALRAGATRAQWAKGDLPVAPYPSRLRPGWSISARGRDAAHVDLTVRKTAQDAEIYAVELERIGGRWLVDSAVPRVTLGGNGKVFSYKDLQAGPTATTRARLSKRWLLLPVAVLALLVLTPVGVVAFRWARDRRPTRVSG